MRKPRKEKKTDERFATKVIVVIGASTAVFVVAQYVSYLITGTEQETLIQWYFRGVVIECGTLMLKRVAEVIVGRIKKEEHIETDKEKAETPTEYGMEDINFYD